MPCPMAMRDGVLRDMLNKIITTVAWLLADWMGWRTALAVYPPMLRNKVAIVTGANSGIGLETTKALLQQGATVIMACRSLQHGHMAREDILKDTRNHGALGEATRRLIVMHLDYEDFSSIKKFADDFHQRGLPLHVLVNNAGEHLKPHKYVDCGFERTIASNYFGAFWLTHLLLDDLKANTPARVINMSSVSELLGPILFTRTIPWDDLRGHSLPDGGERSYVMSKTFILMATTRELARRLEGTGVDVIAVHPGIADSTWYLKSDDKYLFSWVVSKVRSVAPWLGCGQPTTSAAISSIYASIAPELTGISSSPRPHGIIDRINRALFGGRLIYFGPAYFANILGGPINFFNTTRCWAFNPWAYNKSACKRLYESTLDLIATVEREMGEGAAQGVAAADGKPTGANSVSNGAGSSDSDFGSTSNGGGRTAEPASVAVGGSSVSFGEVASATSGGLKQRQQQVGVAAAPLGVEDLAMIRSLEAQPARGT